MYVLTVILFPFAAASGDWPAELQAASVVRRKGREVAVDAFGSGSGVVPLFACTPGGASGVVFLSAHVPAEA